MKYTTVMMHIVVIVATLLFANPMLAQNSFTTNNSKEKHNEITDLKNEGRTEISEDEKEIIGVLNNYIEGSSYNKPSLLRAAFHKDATLFLTTKSGSKRFTPEEYIGFFKNSIPNKFNGRQGNIIEVKVAQDIAQARVEIIIAKRKQKFIDLFLLKKVRSGWKIISKTATLYPTEKKKILFIVSNAHFYGNTNLPTGNSFSEIVNAYDVFAKSNYTVDFVSPKGGAIPLAYINTSNELTKKYVYDSAFMDRLKHTKSPDQILSNEYTAVQYIGGGSAMFEVPTNAAIQKIVMDIYENTNGIISAVCHGTAGIVHLKKSNGRFLVDGRRISGYPEDYENKQKPYFHTFPFLLKETIIKRGGTFNFSDRNTKHVEVDGRIITGQNHLSSKGVSEQIIKLLSERK